MTKKFTFIFLIAATIGFALPTWAGENDDPKSLQDLGYEVVGEEKACLQTSRIDRTRILDDYTILFEMRGRRDPAYITRLANRCPGLSFNDGFSYETHGGLLCSVQTIKVLDPSGFGITCGLEKFQPVQKIED